MNRSGGSRPPLPSRVGATAPLPAGVTTGFEISVVVRLMRVAAGPELLDQAVDDDRGPDRRRSAAEDEDALGGPAVEVGPGVLHPEAAAAHGVTTPGTPATVLPS